MTKRSSAVAYVRHRGSSAVCLVWLMLAVYAVSLPLAVRVSGETLVTLVSGSMAPTYPVGSVVVLEKLEPLTGVAVHDVITIKRAQGLPITHRVVEVVNLNGSTAYRTKGDANATPDAELTLASAVIGRVTGPLPTWWSAALWLQGRWQRLLLFGMPLVLIAFAELRVVRNTRRATDGS